MFNFSPDSAKHEIEKHMVNNKINIFFITSPLVIKK